MSNHQQASQHQQLSNDQVIELETRFLNPNGVMSMLLLRMQIRGLDSEITSGRLPQELVNFKCQLREKTRTQLKLLVQKVQSGQITADMYLMCVRKTRASLIELKQASDKSGEGMNRYLIGLATKAKSLMQEEKSLTDNKDASFAKILKIAQLDLETSIYEKIDIDKKPFNEKIKLFLTRYYQYKNLVLYFSKHMKEQMRQELGQKYLPMLTRMGPLILKLEAGEDVQVNTILTTEMIPITKEMALGMTAPVYSEKLNGLIGVVNQCLEVEKKFKMFSRNARKTKLSNWTAQSALKIKSYQALLDSLNSNSSSITPLPIVELREDTRSLFIEDKDVDPIDFILSFSKLTNCPAGQYCLSFSVEIAGKILNDVLPFCDANTLEWNYTRKYARGVDVKQLDDQLHTRSINVIVFKKTFFSKEEYARATIPLAELETKAAIVIPVSLTHKKDHPVLHFGAKMRFCTKLFSPIKVKTLYIIRQYEPINLNENIEQTLLERIPERFREKPTNQSNSNSNNGSGSGSGSGGLQPCLEFLKRDDESISFKVFSQLQENQVPFGLTLDELKNPEDFKTTFSLNYLSKMYPQQQQASSYYAKNGKSDERKRSLKLAEDCLMRKFFMEESFMPKVESGTITLDQVYSQYCETIVKDRLRIKAYLQIGLQEWAAFLLAKRSIYIEDMRENEWEIEDVVDINVEELLSSVSSVELKQQALTKLPQSLTFIRRGVDPEVGILRNLKESDLPKGLSMEDALMPEDLHANFSLPYLNLIVEQYTKAASFYAKSGQANEQKRALTIKEKASQLLAELQAKMEKGEFDMEEIMNFYSNGIVKDRLRIQLYTKIGLYSWLAFAMAKRTLYINDMKDSEIPIQDPEYVNPLSYI